jgi:asparagine synthase (glutamine-hydrolysing)
MTGLKKVLDLDFNLILFGDLLVKMDIATMANSIEGRSPFLSKELLEYIPTIKDSYKIKGTTTKYLLRELAKKYLPAQILHQPKRGFEVPLKNWVNNDLKEPIFSVINSPNAYHKQFINNDLLNKLLTNKMSVPEEKKAKIIWIVYCLDVWYKNIINTK